MGDLQFLPFEDDTFDAVAGFNSFFFAADMVAALREAGRVARPGAPIVIQVWGRPHRCTLDALKHAIAPFLPPPDPDAPRGSALWEPGVLERIAGEAGLRPVDTFDITWAYRYPDDEAVVRGMLAAGGSATPSRRSDRTTSEARSWRRSRRTAPPTGGYRLENEWHYLIATAASEVMHAHVATPL